MGEAKRRKEWMEKMKIIGPDGRPLPLPTKDNPLPRIGGDIPLAIIVEHPGTGQFSVKRLRNFDLLDLAKLLSNLSAAVLQSYQNAQKGILGQDAPPPEEPPPTEPPVEGGDLPDGTPQPNGNPS